MLAACTPEAATEQPTEQTAKIDRPCESRSFEGSRFTICRLDARADEIRLAWRGQEGDPLRSLSALQASLGSDAARARFAMNAGMYDEAGAPIGLFVEDGKERRPLNLKAGPGNFHLLPNGVFSADKQGRFAVTVASRFKARVRSPRWATQSGPMLVIDGKLHPKFDPDGESRLVRNGVGVQSPHTAFFAISEEGVSFGRFARFFRDALGCANALYLDGAVSSLWDPNTGRQDAYSGLGPMAVVLSRQTRPVSREITRP